MGPKRFQGPHDPRDGRDFGDSRDPRDFREPRGSRKPRCQVSIEIAIICEILGSQGVSWDYKNAKYSKDPIDSRDPRDFRETECSWGPRDSRDPRDLGKPGFHGRVVDPDFFWIQI
jgi:hypothetical protein